ncbi:unnamed protein product [Amoebophrya sp. A120]|nr:unnamed protein product [Amoebophrya sp. A120]|eukprot:GSA120T00014794001.1
MLESPKQPRMTRPQQGGGQHGAHTIAGTSTTSATGLQQMKNPRPVLANTPPLKAPMASVMLSGASGASSSSSSSTGAGPKPNYSMQVTQPVLPQQASRNLLQFKIAPPGTRATLPQPRTNASSGIMISSEGVVNTGGGPSLNGPSFHGGEGPGKGPNTTVANSQLADFHRAKNQERAKRQEELVAGILVPSVNLVTTTSNPPRGGAVLQNFGSTGIIGGGSSATGTTRPTQALSSTPGGEVVEGYTSYHLDSEDAEQNFYNTSSQLHPQRQPSGGPSVARKNYSRGGQHHHQRANANQPNKKSVLAQALKHADHGDEGAALGDQDLNGSQNLSAPLANALSALKNKKMLRPPAGPGGGVVGGQNMNGTTPGGGGATGSSAAGTPLNNLVVPHTGPQNAARRASLRSQDRTTLQYNSRESSLQRGRSDRREPTASPARRVPSNHHMGGGAPGSTATRENSRTRRRATPVRGTTTSNAVSASANTTPLRGRASPERGSRQGVLNGARQRSNSASNILHGAGNQNHTSSRGVASTTGSSSSSSTSFHPNGRGGSTTTSGATGTTLVAPTGGEQTLILDTLRQELQRKAEQCDCLTEKCKNLELEVDKLRLEARQSVKKVEFFRVENEKLRGLLKMETRSGKMLNISSSSAASSPAEHQSVVSQQGDLQYGGTNEPSSPPTKTTDAELALQDEQAVVGAGTTTREERLANKQQPADHYTVDQAPSGAEEVVDHLPAAEPEQESDWVFVIQGVEQASSPGEKRYSCYPDTALTRTEKLGIRLVSLRGNPKTVNQDDFLLAMQRSPIVTTTTIGEGGDHAATGSANTRAATASASSSSSSSSGTASSNNWLSTVRNEGFIALYAVFDGFGENGSTCSRHCKQRMAELVFSHPLIFQNPQAVLAEAFEIVQGELGAMSRGSSGRNNASGGGEGEGLLKLGDGASAALALLLRLKGQPAMTPSSAAKSPTPAEEEESWVVVGSIGDSRVVLASREESQSEGSTFGAVALSKDHTILTHKGEAQRLRNNPKAESQPQQLTRHLGLPADLSVVKTQAEVNAYKINPGQDLLLILGTKGLWNQYSNSALVSALLANGVDHLRTSCEKAKMLQSSQSGDDVTAIAVSL